MNISARSLVFLGSGYALPSNVLNNAEVWPETSNWVETRLGIRERRVLSADEHLLELCEKAAINAFEESGTNARDVGCVIVATSTPDYTNPSMASILHGRLGLSSESAAFDIQAVCAGFIYALGISSSLKFAGIKGNILIIGADQFSRITNWEDRNCVFFGDGAGAVILGEQHNTFRMLTKLKAEGEGWSSFHTPSQSPKFIMNTHEVYNSATTKLPRLIEEVCEDLGIEVDNIDKFFVHQPSKPVLDGLQESLKIPAEKLPRNIEFHANTAGATIPLIFAQNIKAIDIKDGSWVCFAAIGAGWVWGVSIMEWVGK
jgi:3-oxoacyl-[acyl-carrier-protein] synthase-3